MEQLTAEELDKLVNDKLEEMIKENSPKLMMFLLGQIGRQMVGANATSSEYSISMTIANQRYRVITKSKLKKIKNA